jgi:Acetyltransferase (GNAT) domain
VTDIRLEPWGEDDLPLLRKTLGDPEMTRHLGGPESEEKLVERQRRFERLADSGTGHMFRIVEDETGESVGSVGYWQRDWRGEEIYEIGWMVVPQFQGRGIAVAATRRQSSTPARRADAAASTPSRASIMRPRTRSAGSSASSLPGTSSSSIRRAT